MSDNDKNWLVPPESDKAKETPSWLVPGSDMIRAAGVMEGRMGSIESWLWLANNENLYTNDGRVTSVSFISHRLWLALVADNVAVRYDDVEDLVNGAVARFKDDLWSHQHNWEVFYGWELLFMITGDLIPGIGIMVNGRDIESWHMDGLPLTDELISATALKTVRLMKAGFAQVTGNEAASSIALRSALTGECTTQTVARMFAGGEGLRAIEKSPKGQKQSKE